MKTSRTFLTLAMGLAGMAITARAQTLAGYQNIINGQSPLYYNTLDNTLTPTTGTGTFSATTGATFSSDYFGNANDAVAFAASTDQLAYSTGANIIANSGVANSVGSLSLLFYTPNTALGASTGQYIFSNGDASSATNNFALELTGGSLALKAGNKTITLPALTGGEWYYFAATWNFSGASTSAYGINYYLGVAGQSGSLTTGFVERGGSGNISSTALLGNGGAFVLSGHQAGGSGGWELSGNPGSVDELTTWNTQLTSDQITDQYDGLVPTPEPSASVLLGAGGLGLMLLMKIRRRIAG